MDVYFLTSHLRPHDGQSKAVLNFVKGLGKLNVKTQIITLTSDITDNPNMINLKGTVGLLYNLKIFFGNPSPPKKFHEWLNDDAIFIVANDDLVPIINLKRNGKMILWAQGVLGLIFFWKEFYRKQRI
ncbi:hypothetical protein [Acidianus sp. RZ1]|uniref:hypothetical protein n=1 Tax=Acidianus sp. RZ1 TaxID=1540082 RepID=UPI0020A593CD|nr:hypothetical protein [Acidianus sp. RZ1]